MVDASHTLVIVEDDPMLLKYISTSFKSDPQFSVFTAKDGDEGITLIREKKPDLVLLDIIMPRKNGFEVLREMKGDVQMKKIPVIVLSNLGQKADIDQAKKLGAIDYLVKVDLDVSDIIRRVKEYLKIS